MIKLNKVHPGEILQEEFLKPLKISPYRLAKEIKVAPIRISEIIRGKRGISVNTALRFSQFFGNSAEFWINLQLHFDLAMEKPKFEKKLKFKIKTWETSELLSIPGFKDSIKKADKEIANGDIYSMEDAFKTL